MRILERRAEREIRTDGRLERRKQRKRRLVTGLYNTFVSLPSVGRRDVMRLVRYRTDLMRWLGEQVGESGTGVEKIGRVVAQEIAENSLANFTRQVCK